MKIIMMQLVLLVGCGSLPEGEQGKAGSDGEPGVASRYIVEDADGDEIGGYVGISNEELLIEVDGKMIVLIEERKAGKDPRMVVSSGNECNYESQDCSGECLTSWFDNSHYHFVGKDGIYERPKQEIETRKVNSYWFAGECVVRSIDLDSIPGNKIDLPQLEGIEFPVKIVLK